MVNWDEIMREYVAGGETYRSLAKKHRLSLSSVEKHGKSGNWRSVRAGCAPDEANKRRIKRDDSDRIRSAAGIILDKISLAVESGEISVSDANLKQLTGAVRDIMDILGVMTPADAEEHAAKLEKLRGVGDGVVSVVLGEAEEWSV